MSRRLGELAHLAGRFGGHAASIWRPSLPSSDDEAWARSWLSDAEIVLWTAQAPVDRTHSLAVARRVGAGAGPDDDHASLRWVVAAALLHDVGKADAPLGLTGRTAATLLELAGIRQAPGRLGRYLRYPETGADALARAGSDPRVVAWAREHHLPRARRSASVPADVADALAAADRGGPVRRPSGALEQSDGPTRPA